MPIHDRSPPSKKFPQKRLLPQHLKTYHCSRRCVVLLLLIDGLSAVALAGLWYFLFARYNRQKGVAALRWVQIACSSHGRIVETRWLGASSLQAQLSFASHWFENARVTVR